MKVLEIKNNLVKIAYDVKDNLALSGFVIIEDENNPYVAQVMNIKADSISNYAIVKLLFTFDKDGILKNYNGTIPSLKATVSALPASELLDIIPKENPIILGELAQQNFQLKIDKSVLENNFLICSNSLENTTLFLNNITSQVEEKTVIFDMEGQFDFGEKIKLGRDFKLPLNYDTIDFIYENELDDVDATSKAIIQDIFLEVQKYTKTLPEGYLPFDNFLNVVDAQYKETQMPALVLLKNKLLKYKELNAFAENLKDIMNLSIELENNSNIVIDLAELPNTLKKEVVHYVYYVLNSINDNFYAFVKVDNENSDKRLLRRLISLTNVSTTIICSHEYKYLSELKENAQNLVLFTPQTLQHDFASYNTFLNKLNSDEFIVYGAHTQNIPLIVELAEIDENDSQNVETTVTVEDNSEIEVDPVESFANEEVPSVQEDVLETNIEEQFETPEITEPEILEPEIQEPQIQEPVIQEPEIENILADDEIQFEENELVSDDDLSDLTSEEVLSEKELTDDEPTEEELIDKVSKDVDRAFYEKLPDEEELPSFDENIEIQDELTEDDLNLIDNLNDEEITLTEDVQSDVEIEYEEETPPVVPIYSADDIEEKEIPQLESGDRVSTAKYGEGVVEKMIKYGNKTLCSIEFPNIGRRLLDPAMTEITKLD